MRNFFVSLLAAALAAPAFAQTNDTIRAFNLPLIEQLGQAMYAQDQYAAQATEVVFATRGRSNADGIRGWLVVPDGAGQRVHFIREGDAGPEIAYDVIFVPGAQPVLAVDVPKALSDDELAQYRARQLALQSIERPCSDRYNTIVLRDPEQADRWLVWALAGTTDSNKVMIGGHYRFTISADGRAIEARDALSRSCLVLEKSAVPAGAQPAALTVTHTVSPTPIETHVFLSLLHRQAIYIGTADRSIWAAERGKFRRLR